MVEQSELGQGEGPGIQRDGGNALEEGAGEVTLTGQRGSFQQKKKCPAGAGGPARHWVLGSEHLPPLSIPRFLHKMENSAGNFRAEASGGQSQAG